MFLALKTFEVCLAMCMLFSNLLIMLKTLGQHWISLWKPFAKIKKSVRTAQNPIAQFSKRLTELENARCRRIPKKLHLFNSTRKKDSCFMLKTKQYYQGDTRRQKVHVCVWYNKSKKSWRFLCKAKWFSSHQSVFCRIQERSASQSFSWSWWRIRENSMHSLWRV